MAENTDTTKPYFQCIKTSLKSVARNPAVIEKLTSTAILTSRIMTHTLQFMKLYFIHCYDHQQPIPNINRHFVTAVMKVLCEPIPFGGQASAGTQQLKALLAEFSSEHYDPIMQDTLNYRHLSTVLDYMAMEVITMYENNIKQRFCEYVERFVNVSLQKQERIEAIKASAQHTSAQKSNLINALGRELRKVKNDILCLNSPKTSDAQYHAWIDAHIIRIMPQRALRQESVYYDIQCNPQDYLPFMIYMMKSVEATGSTLSNVFPLRSQIVPQHFRLDTTSLVKLLFTNKNGKRSNYLEGGNLRRNQSDAWRFFFKTEMKCFHRTADKHAYTFHHQIVTDGVSCSIVLIRKDKAGSIVKQPKGKIGGVDQYIDELSQQERDKLVGKKIVGVDPNMGNLLYCVDSDQRDQTKFRYTQNTRRMETKFKKYRDLRLALQGKIVDGKSAIEWQAEMSAFNKKTLDFEQFKVYIQHKNALNARLAPLYEKYLFRKLKLGSYCRRQITEARMLRRFQEQFGPPEEAVVCIGDWAQKKHMKFKEPVKGIGFRTLFRKAGYSVYLVDEFRTSARCSACNEHGVCTKFKWCDNPRPYRNGRVLCHGLVKCQTCSRLWNRDMNASTNIWKVASNAIQGLARPEYLQRAG